MDLGPEVNLGFSSGVSVSMIHRVSEGLGSGFSLDPGAALGHG